MSYSRGNGQNGGHFYSNITQPIKIDLNFVVDATNGNGLGVRSIKSNGYIENVFMHTSSTPGKGGNNLTNPNPAVGYALIQLKNNYRYYLGGFSGFVSPASGSNVTSTTTGGAYIITSVGTTTLAQWQAAGLLAGFTPAVGAPFIAIKTGALGGTGTVQVPSVSGITSVEVVGDPNMLISNSSIASNAGAILIVQFLAATNSSTTTLIATAPAAGSVVGMSLFYDISSVTIDGL